MDVYPVDSILVGAEEFVYVTHVTHQQLFYIHVESRSKILEDIMNKLETRYTHLRPEEKPLLNKRLGSLCAAKFTDDGIWYRAIITGLFLNGDIQVQFVDYGNTDYVTEERIKAIDADLIKYPVQSYRCCLADVSCSSGFWTPKLIVQFQDKLCHRRFRTTFVGKHEASEVYQLQMWDSDGNINQQFGAVSRDKSPVRQASPAVVAGQQTEYEIHIVHTDDDDGVNDLADSMEAVLSDRDLSKVVPDFVVYSQFTKDDASPRALTELCSDNPDIYYICRFLD